MIGWPLLIAVIGLLMWAFLPDKLSQIGWVLFQVGAFWAVAMTCGSRWDGFHALGAAG